MTPVEEVGAGGGQREDSPICLIHFSHPFVYIKSPEELLESELSSEGEDEEDVEPSPVTPAASLLPLERALEGPSSDLLTQLLFPELNETEAKGNLETVLAMLRDAWSRSRPSSGSQLASQQQQKRTVSSNRRQLSAPETRIRRYTIRTTTTTFESSNPTTSRSAPPALSSDMCTDSVTSTATDSNSKMLQNNCYCHTYKQNEFKFSCKLNFEETRRHYYNCNYLNAYNMMPEYYPKLIPRYSSLPRSLSMLANCSSPSTSTSSVSSDEENQSLADSLEDISPYNSRLPYDDKPVRGAPPLLPHRPAPRIPIPRSEKFFIPLTDRETNEMLLLPPTLREKLERRRLELENKPKSSMNNRGLVVAQKSPRPLRSRRILGTKFQRFECIPEENEARRAGRFSHTRNYVSRERGLEGSRGLQAIMRDPHEVKVGLQQHQALEPAALQEVLPSSAVVARSKEVTSELARGRQAMGEDLVAVTTGWVNFYMLRGEETTTTTASSDSASTTVDSRGRRSRRTWSRGQTTRGAAVTAVSVSGRSSTVRVQQAPRPLVFASASSRRRADSEPEMGRNAPETLPRLPHSGDGVRVPGRERPAILPSLGRRGVPLIRVRQATSTAGEGEGSDTAGVSLPALTSSTSSTESPRPLRRGSVTRNLASKSSRGSRQVARLQQKQEVQVKSAVMAERTTAPPGMWSVTVSGVCPQPEMEVRLVFPPSSETQAAVTAPTPTPAIAAPADTTDVLHASPDSTSHFTLKFKNQQQPSQPPQQQRKATPPSPTSRGRGRGSAGSSGSRSNSNSPVSSPRRRGSFRALPSPPECGPVALKNDTSPAILRGGDSTAPVALRGGGDLTNYDDPVAPEVRDPNALEALMWPEMQALLEEQVISIKKQHTRVSTTTTTSSSAATVVERLRGGEGAELQLNNQLNSQLQAVQQEQQALAVRGAAITTRRKKRASS